MKYSFCIVVDSGKCRGCKICELVCSVSHAGEFNLTKARIRCVMNEIEGVMYSVPVLCQQCEKPVCMDVCPVDAISVDVNTGAKRVMEDRCIGCRRCVYVCPFGGVSASGDSGTVYKCDLCDGDPLCVRFCPYDALEYVRLDKLDMVQKRKGLNVVIEAEEIRGE